MRHTLALLATLALTGACGGQVAGADGGTTLQTDGGADADGGVCVDLEVSSSDTSCASDSDCIAVAAPGVVCSGYDCLCPGATINAKSEAAYDAQRSKIEQGPGPQCGCPFLGAPHCIAGKCVLCPSPSDPNLPPGCPDGGP